MKDPRYQQLAEILVQQCIETRPGENIWIRALSPSSLVLAREVYKAIVLAGAIPMYDIIDDSVSAFFYKHANSLQLTQKPELTEFMANKADKIITIVAEDNKGELSAADPKKVLERSKLMRPVKELIMSKPWVLTYVPTPAMAQDAHMSMDDFEDFYFGATLRDWSEMENVMMTWKERLTGVKTLRVVGEKTNLTMSVEGRTWIADDWKANMPGGEVFTSPVAETVEGEIYFTYPLYKEGKIIRDIHLFFEKGRVVKATASENEEYLHHILDTDEDARKLGEVAFGGNPGITRYMFNMLFDEKMAGTMHFALGQGFSDCGGTTQSAIHMDIVKNMRLPGSEVYLDGKIFLRDGVILL
jgi:aminopeptidase